MVRRLHLIVNPKGGVGDNVALADEAEAVLGEHEVEVVRLLTKYAGHARELVEGLECRAGDAICGLGGDGTMHELVNGLMQRPEEERVPLALLPGGTGNSFLRDLDCVDAGKVLNRIAGGERRSIDLFELLVNGRHERYGFNIVGWGLASAANELAESLRYLGRRRYDIASVLQVLRNRTYRARMEFEGEVIDDGFTLVSLSNTVHTGEGMRLAPKARLDDGLLDLVYVKRAPRWALFRLFAKLPRGEHVDDSRVIYAQTARLKLTTDETLPINVDGELIDGGSFEVRVLPCALDVLI